MSDSRRFVDFGYEPGTLVLGGMWLNMKIFDLCVHGSPYKERGFESCPFTYQGRGWGLSWRESFTPRDF
ncbi:MAG: hypothetical protein KAF91_30320 [Nostoc sp. TH1S01]|nr:hypothetical protein [Nostoc sp. TH1S01]